MDKLNKIRRAARRAKMDGRHPFLDVYKLTKEDIQKLMDESGFPNRKGFIYSVCVEQGVRYLRFDGIA